MSNTKTFPKVTVILDVTANKILEIASDAGNDSIDLNNASATIWVDNGHLKIEENKPLSNVTGKTVYPKAKLTKAKFSIIGTDEIAERIDDANQDRLIIGTDEIAEGRSIGNGHGIRITTSTSGDFFLVEHGTV